MTEEKTTVDRKELGSEIRRLFTGMENRFKSLGESKTETAKRLTEVLESGSVGQTVVCNELGKFKTTMSDANKTRRTSVIKYAQSVARTWSNDTLTFRFAKVKGTKKDYTCSLKSPKAGKTGAFVAADFVVATLKRFNETLIDKNVTGADRGDILLMLARESFAAAIPLTANADEHPAQIASIMSEITEAREAAELTPEDTANIAEIEEEAANGTDG